MKLLKPTLFFGGLLALATSLSAESTLINFNVPFTFVAGTKVMPAGTYTIAEPSSHGILLIRGSEPNSSAMVLVSEGTSTASHAGVKFSRRGSAVVLSTVDVPGGSSYSIISPAPKTAAAVSVALPRK
jgi:hypothetical protein